MNITPQQKKLFEICGLVIAILLALYIVLQFKTVAPQSTTNLPTDAQKRAVIKRIAETQTKALTSSEQISIINFVSRSGATFTPDETASITKALRKQ